MTGRRPAATCAPAHPADPGWRSRRGRRIRLPRRRFGGRIHRRTPNTVPAASFPRRRAGRRTTPPRGAACGGAPGRAVTRPAAGTGHRDDHAPRWRSSTPSAKPPTRSPTESRPGAGRSPPPRPPHQLWPSRSAEPQLRARSTNRLHCGRVDSRRDIQRGHRPHLLVGDPQSFAAGGHDSHRRRLREDRLDQIGGGVKHVLAVVEHQQPDPALQRGGHRLAHGLAWLLGDAQHRRHRVGHRRRIGDRRQFENPDAVGKFIGQSRCDLESPGGSCRPRPPRSTSPTDEPSPPLAPRRVRTRAR